MKGKLYSTLHRDTGRQICFIDKGVGSPQEVSLGAFYWQDVYPGASCYCLHLPYTVIAYEFDTSRERPLRRRLQTDLDRGRKAFGPSGIAARVDAGSTTRR